MMRLNNIKLSTKFSRVELLAKLRENAEKHKQIVREARDGYVTKAMEALTDRLADLEAGKPVSLAFTLYPPADHSEVYRTTIGMFEMSREEEITLCADEFRQLVQDEWDWTDNFLVSNRAYSSTAQREAGAKGL